MGTSTKKVTKLHKGPPWYRSSRYFLAALAAIGYSHFFLQRVNLSMAIVCMVNHTAIDILKSQSQGSGSKPVSLGQDGAKAFYRIGTTPADIFEEMDILMQMNETMRNKLTTTEAMLSNKENLDDSDSVKSTPQSCTAINMNGTEREDGELVWTKQTQGIILGGLYWGYAAIQLPSQRIIQKLGSKWLSLISVLVMSTMTMLAPMAAKFDPWALMTIRIIQGLASALGVPAIYAMWGRWAPPEERTKLMSICFSGSMIANAIVYPTSGLLCRYGFGGGWPSVFYVFGIVGFVWCILWAVFVFETPEEHPRIDPDERVFIVNSIGRGNQNEGSIPWMKLLKSPPVWAVVLAQLGYDYAFFMLLAVLPQYMREVLKFDIKSNGLYTMMPHIAHYIFTNLWGLISASLMARGIMSVCKVRKLSTIIGDIIPAAMYIIISFLDCSHSMLVVVLMTCAIGISGTNMQGFLVNPYDIAPKYATAILCLSNTVAVASGIVSPFLVAAMTPDKTREQWQMVFFATAGITTSCLLFYLIFGLGREMDWARNECEITVETPTIDKSSTSLNSSISKAALGYETAEKISNGDTDRYSHLIGGYCKDVTTKLLKDKACDIDIQVKVTSTGDCDVSMKLVQNPGKSGEGDDSSPETTV